MFAIKYCCDIAKHLYDFVIFETVKAAKIWWISHIGSGGRSFIDMLFVVPPGTKDPLEWCKDNIVELQTV